MHAYGVFVYIIKVVTETSNERVDSAVSFRLDGNVQKKALPTFLPRQSS